MKILLIGGTGLISTPIVSRLLARGDDVALFNRGHRPAPHGARQIIGDRTDYADFDARMRDESFDCVLDMVGYRAADGDSVVRAFEGRIAQFIFCSTVDVYAKPAARYPVRDDEPYGPLNDYGRQKVAIESTLRAAHERGAFAVTILRPAHTYDDNGALIHGFGPWFERLRDGEPLIVHGDGTSLWSQAHAEDVAAAFVAAIGNQSTLGRAYTVTNAEAHDWNRLYAIAAHEMGAPPPQLLHIPTDVLRRVALDWSASIGDNFFGHNLFDISADKADLGYRTTIDFRTGARRVLPKMQGHATPPDSAVHARYNRIVDAWKRAEIGIEAAVLENEARRETL